MIIIEKIVVSGIASGKEFQSEISFQSGVNIVSAPNGFGKTLISTSLLWCLGLEQVLVVSHDDPSFLPESIRDSFELEDNSLVKISSSFAEIHLRKTNADEKLILKRCVKGTTLNLIDCQLITEDNVAEFKLTSNSFRNVSDVNRNISGFLVEWSGIKGLSAISRDGKKRPLYLENLFSLVCISQMSGWTDLYSNLVRRYGTLQLEECVFEGTLGLYSRYESRQKVLEEAFDDKNNKKEIVTKLEEINQFIEHINPDYKLKYQKKKIDKLIEDYKGLNLLDYLKKCNGTDYNDLVNKLNRRIHDEYEKLQKEEVLGENIKDDGFQEKLDELMLEKLNLKTMELEKQNVLLSLEDKERTVDRIQERLESAKHLLDFKERSIGYFDHELICPTCTQGVDTTFYNLENLSSVEVAKSIKSYQDEKNLFSKAMKHELNLLNELTEKVNITKSKINVCEKELEPYLKNISITEGKILTLVEKISDIKKDIFKYSRVILDAASLSSSLSKVFEGIDVEEDHISQEVEDSENVVLDKFLRSYKKMLKKIELTVFQGDKNEADKVKLNEDYIPIFKGQYLKNFASASDQCRIILPYVLSVLNTSLQTSGNHIGFTLFDEPIQQNPDEKSRERMINFFKDIENDTEGQVIILTNLSNDEVSDSKDRKTFKVIHENRFLKIGKSCF